MDRGLYHADEPIPHKECVHCALIGGKKKRTHCTEAGKARDGTDILRTRTDSSTSSFSHCLLAVASLVCPVGPPHCLA